MSQKITSVYVVELIGTFFLVLTIALAIRAELALLAPVAIGSVLIAMIFAGGHVSGAHYNPAVTLAFWLCGKLPGSRIPGYIVAQVLGAGLAAWTAGFLAPVTTLTVPAALPTAPLLLAEALFTFALCWVILNVAIAHGTHGNPFYGLAIGLVVVAGAYAVGPISGAVFNPAVAVGLCWIGSSAWTSIWTYFLAQFVAAIAAALLFRTSIPH